MQSAPFCRTALVLVLVASVALAGNREKLAVRTLLLSEHPDVATHRLYVKGQVVTVLRFDQPCDPGKTKMLGWEGRFEPLACVGRKVVLEPLRDLNSDEGILLVVVLTDGTEIPFLLRSPGREAWAWTDQQVNVFKDRESYEAMFSALNDALKENAVLREDVERFRKEETSEDHALAALLATGAVAQTPFIIAGYLSGGDDDTEVHATLFRGKGKAAAVFKIKNLALDRSWSVKSARLLTIAGGQERPAAMRSASSSIAPGASGVVAVIVDKSAFIEDGKLTALFLEVYRHDGLRQALVQLDPSLVAE
jgi:hypothetical protein